MEEFWTSTSYNLMMFEGTAWSCGAKSQCGCIRRSRDKEEVQEPWRQTTRPSCRPSQGIWEKLDPQLDRVVGRVLITERNSTHNSTELWDELWLTEKNSGYNSTELQPVSAKDSKTRPETRSSFGPSREPKRHGRFVTPMALVDLRKKTSMSVLSLIFEPKNTLKRRKTKT